MRSVSTKLPEEIIERLKEKAREEGVSVSALIRKLILQYLGEHGKPAVDPGKPSLEERLRRLEQRVEELEKKLNKMAGIERFMWGGRSGGRMRR